nr:MAG TPA: hypothetical protein [Bacteriophage sp.]
MIKALLSYFLTPASTICNNLGAISLLLKT